MIHKPLSDITEADLAALVTDEVEEGVSIDYKRDLPGDGRDSKSEFLADITSFANGAGGDLIIGITEDKGLPVDLVGIDVPDQDALGLRIENMCRDNVEPRLPTMQQRFVLLANGKHVLILRIGHSWNGPHRNKLDRHFYSRNNRGKYPLDVSELRNAFTLGSVTSERIRDFRAARLAALNAGRAPVPLVDGARMVLHIVPIASVTGPTLLNVDDPGLKLDTTFRPLGGVMGYNPKVNLDGHVASYDAADGCPTYTQLFRNGIVESVIVFSSRGEKNVYSAFEEYVVDGCSKFIPKLQELGFEGPVVIMLSFLDVKGYCFAPSSRAFGMTPKQENEAIIPDVILEPGASLEPLLEQIFRIVWNSFGTTRPQGFKPRW